MTRTWSAEIILRLGPAQATLIATPSEYDLLSDQTKSAVREAACLTNDATEVHVVIYKTTKARGAERNRSYTVFRDRRGQVRYQ